jgi:hypothetical protein
MEAAARAALRREAGVLAEAAQAATGAAFFVEATEDGLVVATRDPAVRRRELGVPGAPPAPVLGRLAEVARGDVAAAVADSLRRR